MVNKDPDKQPVIRNKAAERGAKMVRVHDVVETARALRMADAVVGRAGESSNAQAP